MNHSQPLRYTIQERILTEVSYNTKMYEEYSDERELLVNQKIFNKEYNYSFHVHEKDKCNLCTMYNRSVADGFIMQELTEQYEKNQVWKKQLTRRSEISNWQRIHVQLPLICKPCCIHHITTSRYLVWLFCQGHVMSGPKLKQNVDHVKLPHVSSCIFSLFRHQQIMSSFIRMHAKVRISIK